MSNVELPLVLPAPADMPPAAVAAHAAATTTVTPSTAPPVEKIIVAIHGIGSQSRSGTVRTVASRFGDRCSPPLPAMPLGYFNVGDAAEVRLSYLEPGPKDRYLEAFGFAEVFWADIPKGVVKQEDLLEETKAWGRTVVSRAEATYNRSVPEKERRLSSTDFSMAAGVVDEVVETVGVMENLLAVAGKAGVFKFDLAPLLRDYIGDVQLVADFPYQRDRILYRFHSVIAQLVERVLRENLAKGSPIRPEIYIVAHSEGTVISFLGMLEALAGKSATDPEGKGKTYDGSTWIGDVRGYMTIGSPIDKHLGLWLALWRDVRGKLKSSVAADKTVAFPRGLTLPKKIKWRNYYDYGDPIGFQLNSAVEFLFEEECAAFEFNTAQHDIGFGRYALPGKAHTDYWADSEVFAHFIDDVIIPNGNAQRPGDRFWQGRVSTAVPYLLTFVLHFAAVFVLYKGMTAFTPVATLSNVPLQLALYAGLLSSITVTARIPRLVKIRGPRWYILAAAFFAIGVLCICLLPEGSQKYLGGPFADIERLWAPGAHSEKLALIVAAAFVSSTGWWAKRVPARGRRWLVGVGAFVIGYAVLFRLMEASVGGSAIAPAWPMFLAGAAFLYLWWLGILFFDLTFVWHRYIRNSVAIDTLRQWKQGKDAAARPLGQLFKEPNPTIAKAP